MFSFLYGPFAAVGSFDLVIYRPWYRALMEVYIWWDVGQVSTPLLEHLYNFGPLSFGHTGLLVADDLPLSLGRHLWRTLARSYPFVLP